MFDRATGPKEIEWLDSANHIDIYDRPELVEPGGARASRGSWPSGSRRARRPAAV